MPRQVRDARLETRAARERLEERHEPYWRGIGPGAAIGYRKAPKGGRWYARWRPLNERSGGGYSKGVIGTADDVRDANGLDILSYAQAQARAHAFFDQCAREHMGLVSPDAARTVADAVGLYLAWFKSDRRSYAETKGSAERHILPALGAAEIMRLSPQRIRQWRDELAASPALGRTGKPIVRAGEDDPEERARRRKVTANRVLVILKAALEHAYREHGAGVPDA